MPLVDLLQGKVVAIEKFAHPPPVPMGDNGNYHRASQPLPWRTGLKPLHVVQPEGPSFSVDGWRVAWQHWTFRLGFNAREGLVLYDVAYEDVQEGGRVRPVVHRASIVEMAVPYGDPVMPFNRKCALDAGDYGLGFAANSLALGCDCLGTIRYFDAVVNDAAGEPVVIKNAVCLHEEDGGLLARRVARARACVCVLHARPLTLACLSRPPCAVEAPGLPHGRHRVAAQPPAGGVLHHDGGQLRGARLRARACVCICTACCCIAPPAFPSTHTSRSRSPDTLFSLPGHPQNPPQYAFYWSFGLDGSISHEVKLTGLLATGQPHAAEAASDPPYGTLVAPGVNAQHHQHFFCARLDMAVDDAAAGGAGLVVSEVEAVADAPAPGGANNGFVAAETPLASVHAAMRRTSPATGRFWKVSNPAAVHRVTRKPVAYALIPGKCAAMMADAADSAVARRAHFVTRNLWVTPHDDGQLYPAGTYCMQSERCTGLKVWTAEDVALAGRDPVLWYCFGITHLVRPEDWCARARGRRPAPGVWLEVRRRPAPPFLPAPPRPVMPCESTGFTLKPWGFFHVNPSVTIPPSVDAASALHTGDGAAAAAAPGVACH